MTAARQASDRPEIRDRDGQSTSTRPRPSLIDTDFDVRTDSGGKDPDSHSATLRRYHRMLWNKPLPGGAEFDLDERLHHSSSLGDFWLSSDAITHTYSDWSGPASLLEIFRQIPAEQITEFYDLGCTVGAYTVFPTSVHAGGRWRQSINQARGMHPRIRDRFDLTLECIRRHYEGSPSPLSNALGWYDDFFALFGGFRGYVDHCLLNDLVTDDYRTVVFHTRFDGFETDPLPARSVAEYREYMERTMGFVRARNRRIAAYAAEALQPRPGDSDGE